MTEKTVRQIDRAGRYLGNTVADESPLEPGVWLMPAGTVEAELPDSWSDDKWPCWDGGKFVLRNKQEVVEDPVEKLNAFLHANPDVAALLK